MLDLHPHLVLLLSLVLVNIGWYQAALHSTGTMIFVRFKVKIVKACTIGSLPLVTDGTIIGSSHTDAILPVQIT